MEKDSLTERGRALEDDYFRKKDRELIEKMRLTSDATGATQALGTATGLSDPAILQELLGLGFTPETVALLPLVPVLQVAWAEGGVSDAERDTLVNLARARGIVEGGAADHQLAAWMAQKPGEAVFAGAGRLIRAMLDANSKSLGDLSADDLVHYAEQIAGASGGFLGFGRISAEEKELLERIAADLKDRRA